MTSISDEQLDQFLGQMKHIYLSEQYDETQEHPVHDVALLEAWELGDLSDAELRKLNDHRKKCLYCRREIAMMVKNDILTIPPVKRDKFLPGIRRVGAQIVRHRQPLLAVAAILVISVIGVWMFRSDGTDVVQLNLKQSTLEDYGYDMQGNSGGVKSGGDSVDLDVANEQQDYKDHQEKMAKRPDDVKLRFEYGQWLLGLPSIIEEPISEAIKVFKEIAESKTIKKSASDSATVQNALGMAWFMKETGQGNPPVIARGHFLEALKHAPNDKAVNLNLAICLRVLGKEAEAQKHFEKAGIPQ